MTITEQIIARLRSEESYWGVTRPTALFAILALLCGDITTPIAYSAQKPYYKVIEGSSPSSSVCSITRWSGLDRRAYQPKTPLGKKLMALRNQAIAKGLRLLDADGISEEIRRRRGEII